MSNINKNLGNNQSSLGYKANDYQEINITLTPAKGIDVGAGVNEAIKTTIYGGQVGIIFDCRGRPLSLSKEPNKRISELNNWSKALNEYPSLEV